MKNISLILIGVGSLLLPWLSHANDYPVSVKSCGREVVFERPPGRAVSQDVNLTEMMTSLGLQSHMVGYTGVTGWNKPTEKLMAELHGLPELATHYPTVETLLNVNSDFYFAGWNYGMRVGGDVTPQSLGSFGINVYELTESCAQLDQGGAQPATLEQVYQDLTNLGKIFDVEGRAQSLISTLRDREALVVRQVSAKKRLKVFVYDSGEDRAFTAGQLAIPQALITAAGGVNVMDGLHASWTQVGWESVVQADPEVIIIVDYGERSASEKKQFLLTNPALQSIQAIRDQRFVVLPYREVTPGVANIDAIETLAGSFRAWR